MAHKDELYRMPQIVAAAPPLDPASLEQTAALPLGGRVRLDPWTARIELMTNTRVALLSPAEKLPFQVTPLMPYLARFGDAGSAAATAPRAGNEAKAAAGSSGAGRAALAAEPRN
jgi:hypothetical protein